ncbi:MAG TPA: phosphate ABC transporter substrate-binding protein PstS [Caulobacteraceae bacterium]|jgi:phosphate transport system substrate-binding protein
MVIKKLCCVLAGALSGILLGAAAPSPIVVTGAGSTFVNPILSKWTADYMSDYHASGGTKIIYQSIGSGAGIELIKAGKVDFGASDKPLPPDELAKAGLAQFPLVIGGVVPVVNIAGVAPGKLRFTGELLANIYLGKVKRWNDPAITSINPGVALPNADIAVIHRSDGSGTTFNWANYLSKESPEWKAKVGDGTAVAWPVGAGGSGNEGVSALVRQTPNSIGYVELAYVSRDKLSWALVRNKAGRFIAPSQQSFQAAADGVDWNATRDFYMVLTDAPGADAYPITATTFILAPKHEPDHSRTRALIQLFEWALFNGQAQAAALGYVPLPRPLVLRVETYWNTQVSH